MGKTRCTNLASVWTVGPVRYKIDTHLSLGGLNGTVGLAGWHGVTLTEELVKSSPQNDMKILKKGAGETDLEVMDQRLHTFLHCCSWRRDKLVVINLHSSRRHLVQALFIMRRDEQ